ncbi:DNA cytosine methyltransferase [Virgibacillus halodenitrificans]|uniref:DNA cytosine methyltransferase n=1 Tax=Virgibacillus halodenitrificans TaxID=1482 RepID=UPI000EF4C58B|nr:DNA cytosine methyltransferase [Virgibacillus halodenitrificans]
MNINNQEYVVVSLFSGAGGLDTGLESAAIPISLAIDFDEKACETYALNHKNTIVWNRDISTVTGEEIRKTVGNKPMLLIGTPPCQSWSEFKAEINGSKKGIEDKRGQLIYQYLRLVIELEPEAIVFENVPYMVTNSKNLAEFNGFKEQLQKHTGLHLEYQILNAIDYGQAQRRERVIMVGTKADIPSPFRYLRKIDGPKTLRKALKDIPSSDFFHFRKTDKHIMKKIKEGQCWNVLQPEEAYQFMKEDYRGICLDCGTSFQGEKRCPKCHSTRFKNGRGITSYLRRLSWNQPSPTICAVPTNKTHGMLAHPTEERCLSIRESARLMGFPDAYQFAGTIFEQQRQIGNAVPTGMGKAIGNALIEALKNRSSSTKEPMVRWLQYVVTHSERFRLSELEKDFVRISYKRYKFKQPFPQKYEVYIKEIAKKLTDLSKNNAI